MAGVRSGKLEAYSEEMAVFRKKPNRIRGVAGSFDKKHVVIADATAGAGPGIAQVFTDAGALVTVVGPDSPSVELTIRSLQYPPIDPVGEVLGRSSSEKLAEFIKKLPAPIDVLVGNPTSLELDTNHGLGYRGVAVLAGLAAAQMAERGYTGSLVTVVTIGTTDESAAGSAYLKASTQTLARDHASDGIRCNTLLVGHVAADRRGKAKPSSSAMLGGVSVHPVEVGKAAWFLANNDLNAAMTGASLKIDRGASLLRPEW